MAVTPFSQIRRLVAQVLVIESDGNSGTTVLRTNRALFLVASALLIMAHAANAQKQLPPWQPSPGHTQIPIWPGKAPDSVVYDGPEYSVKVEDALVAGKPWVSDERVSTP